MATRGRAAGRPEDGQGEAIGAEAGREAEAEASPIAGVVAGHAADDSERLQITMSRTGARQLDAIARELRMPRGRLIEAMLRQFGAGYRAATIPASLQSLVTASRPARRRGGRAGSSGESRGVA